MDAGLPAMDSPEGEVTILSLFNASRVRRYHTADVQEQSLAQHSWGVAMIVSRIVPQDDPRLAVLLQYALTHDLHEYVSGDSPATAKWKSKELEAYHRREEEDFNRRHKLVNYDDLTPQEQAIVKWADMMELVIWCQKEMTKGNKFANAIYERGRIWIDSHDFPTNLAREMYEQIF
jgi:5'-deoxynucleotidase YfbR-like HD superfamily hydrolase